MLPSYIINSEILLQRFMGNQLAVRKILGCFCDSIPGLIGTLHDNVSESEYVAALVTVHKILRLAICSSAITVQECAFQMEHAVMMEDAASVREIMPLLEQMSDEVIKAVNADNSLGRAIALDTAE